MSVALGAALVLSLAMSGGAQARCSATCLNRKVRQLSSGLIKAEKTIAALSKTVAQQGQQISVLNQTVAAQGATVNGLAGAAKFATFLEQCLFQVPLDQYGESPGEEGYLYETPAETFRRTALDVVPEGGEVGAWFVINGCNPVETASIKAASRRFR
jgi:uncharacterized coiled-coil protein SlyX